VSEVQPGPRAAPPRRPVTIIGAAMDLGQGRRGVDMGPSAIRYAGLAEKIRSLGYEVRDGGNIEAHQVETLEPGDPRAKYAREIMESCAEIADAVAAAAAAGEFALVLGGDHSLAMGVLGGLAREHGPGAVIWIDAHADVNTPATSPSGNVHGMPLAVALGWGGPAFDEGPWPTPSVDESKTVLVGIRSLDIGERERLRASQVKVYTMSDLDRFGVEKVIEGALERVQGAPWVHLSLDMDVVEPEQAPGVGTPVRGGMSYREAHLALELLAGSGLVDSMEVVEVNPILDRENATGELAVELVCSALGQRIL
jgi:arginase